MESQQIVDYIDEQLRAGHSEATLRTHLAAHGWSAAAIDGAFQRHGQGTAVQVPGTLARARRKANAKKARAAVTAKAAAVKTRLHSALGSRAGSKKERKHRVRASNWTVARFAKLTLAVVVLAAAGLGVRTLITSNTTEPPKAAALQRPSFVQLQGSDISMIGGAVALYAQTTDHLPTSGSVQPDGHLLFCGDTCDASIPEVNVLSVYHPASVVFKPYQTGLAAPDKETVYLVAHAKCASESTLGSPNTVARSMVLLYLQAGKQKDKPRCVTL
jgi:hypothetical protein